MTTKGMTLIETIVYIAIFSVASTAIFGTIAYTLKTNRQTIARANVINESRRAIDRVVRDIREMTENDNGNYPLNSADSYEIEFYADTDDNQSIERVRYYISATELRKEQTEPSGDPVVYILSPVQTFVVSGVQNEVLGIPLFTYYDLSGNEVLDTITNLGSISRVDIDLRFIPNLDTAEVVQYRTSIGLRNITI